MQWLELPEPHQSWKLVAMSIYWVSECGRIMLNKDNEHECTLFYLYNTCICVWTNSKTRNINENIKNEKEFMTYNCKRGKVCLVFNISLSRLLETNYSNTVGRVDLSSPNIFINSLWWFCQGNETAADVWVQIEHNLGFLKLVQQFLQREFIILSCCYI